MTRVISFVSQSSPSGVMNPYAKDRWSIVVEITWNKEFVNRVTTDVPGSIFDLIQALKVCTWIASLAIYAKTLVRHVIRLWRKTKIYAVIIRVVTHTFAISRNIYKVSQVRRRKKAYIDSIFTYTDCGPSVWEGRGASIEAQVQNKRTKVTGVILFLNQFGIGDFFERVSLEHFSIESNLRLHWFCLTSLHDWSRKKRRHPFNQSDVKLNPLIILSPAF